MDKSLIMGSILNNVSLRIGITRLLSYPRLSINDTLYRRLSISYSLYCEDKSGNNDLEISKTATLKPDTNSKAEDARRKLHNLLMETRNKGKSKESVESEARKQSLRKNLNLAKPRLKKFVDKRETENVAGLDPKIVHAAHRVATTTATLGQHSDTDKDKSEDNRQIKVRNIESDLLKKLKAVNTETEEAKQTGVVVPVKDLSSLFSSIQIEKDEESSEENQFEHFKPATRIKREPPRRELTQEQMAFMEKRRRLREAQQTKEEEENYVPVDLFNSQPPLGIFSKENTENYKSSSNIELKMWKKCREREMKILSSPAPKNFLEEMAVKTDQGILWKFPINNEQGIEDNKVEPFHAHVFLEHHLEPWCPKTGPVRHFMELVCTGLSKNPYISVEKKLEHIYWYKEYFELPEHNEILRVSGAIE